MVEFVDESQSMVVLYCIVFFGPLMLLRLLGGPQGKVKHAHQRYAVIRCIHTRGTQAREALCQHHHAD